jgi:phage baseplate assembly protein V
MRSGSDDILDALKRLIEPLRRRVNGMVSRVVARNVNNAPGRQEVQLEGLEDELMPIVEHFQNFGFYSWAPVGSEGVGVAVGGYRNHMIALAMSNKSPTPPGMEQGDSAQYCLHPRTFALLKADGSSIQNGGLSWVAAVGDGENTTIVMIEGTTVLRVEDPDSGHFSQITITPEMVKIETLNFIHP